MKPPYGYSLDDYDLDNQDLRHYQSNGTLINKLGQTDTNSLNKLERDYSDFRFQEFLNLDNPIEFSVDYYTSIHKHIFQDIYQWAGEIRAVDTLKGDSLFTPHQKINQDLQKSLDSLEENLKTSFSKDEIGQSLGIFLGEVNRIHPFPEGNGRTQRLFLSTSINDKEYSIDWSTISNERMKLASIQAHENNLNPMIKLIQNSIITKTHDLNFDNSDFTIEDNSSYLHYQNQASEQINGTITNISEKYIVLKNIEDNYIVLNRTEFEKLLPNVKIGESISINPFGLSSKDAIAIEAFKIAIQEKYKDNPKKMNEQLEELNKKIPDIAAGKFNLPEPPMIKQQADHDLKYQQTKPIEQHKKHDR